MGARSTVAGGLIKASGPSIADIVTAELRSGVRSRSFLEAVLVYRYGIAPHEVTKALKDLVLGGSIEQRSIAIKGGSAAPTLIYSIDGFAGVAEYELLLREREALLRREVLRRAGEGYVRGLLKRSKRFKNVTPKRRLGAVSIATGRSGDIVATATDEALAKPLLFEVKNRREIFDYSSRYFAELLAAAIVGGYQPVFVSPFLSDRAQRLCSALGIATLTLGRQLFPRKYRNAAGASLWTRHGLSTLNPTLGPMPVEIISVDRFYQHGMSRDAGLDLSRVRDANWLVAEAMAWEKAAPIIERYLHAAGWLTPSLSGPWNALMAREMGSHLGWAL